MKGGVLEVLLVSAEGLKHARHLRHSSQYVVIQCGRQTQTSKVTSRKDKAVWWNEKFEFKLSCREWKDLSMIRLKIMERDNFLEDCSVGEATIYLRGILREANQKGCIELKSAPYNVVLKDGTYEGELKVGFKITTNVEVESETKREQHNALQIQSQFIYNKFFNFALRQISWPRFFFFQRNANVREYSKKK